MCYACQCDYGKWVLDRNQASFTEELASKHTLAVMALFRSFSGLPLHSKLSVCLPMLLDSQSVNSRPSPFRTLSQALYSPPSSNHRDLMWVLQANRVPPTSRHRKCLQHSLVLGVPTLMFGSQISLIQRCIPQPSYPISISTPPLLALIALYFC